jgi:hypothetical protein
VSECVYCAIRSGFFNALQANFRVSKINSYQLGLLQHKIKFHETYFLMNELQLWMFYWNPQRNTAWYKMHDDLRVCCENRGNLIWVELPWNLMAHSDAREGKWRRNWRMERVVSSLTLPRKVVYPALLTLMRTARLSAVDWTDSLADLNGLVRFGERGNLVSNEIYNIPITYFIYSQTLLINLTT